MRKLMKGQAFVQNFTVNNPSLWSPETPVLYKAVSKIYVKDQLVDEYTTRFGIRSVQVIANKGFSSMASCVSSRAFVITTT